MRAWLENLRFRWNARKQGVDLPAPPRVGTYDLTLFAAAIALLSIGTLLVFSTTARPALSTAGVDPFYHLRHHVVMIGAGGLVFWAAVAVPWRLVRTAARIILPLSILMLVLVAFVGDSRLGARRWFNLGGGITVQPSEIAKIGFALWLATYLEKRRSFLNDLLAGILPLGLMFVLVAGLLVIQPDVGSVVLLGALVVAMLVVGGTRLTLFGMVFGALALALVTVILMQPEKVARFVGWLFPEFTRLGEGYQVWNSQILIGSGGFAGAGLGEGVHHVLGYLPQSANDFIFSVASEELGFVGVVCIVLLYAVIGFRGFAIARAAKDDFQRFAAFSMTLLLTLPALVHMGVDLGLLPTKGLVCPFVSYGGSAMVASLGTLGFLERIHLEATAVPVPTGFVPDDLELAEEGMSA